MLATFWPPKLQNLIQKRAKIFPKIDHKTKRKYHGKYQENNENTIWKRSVKTSKTMLPCGRGGLLAKAASFKNIPEDIQMKHEIDAKNFQNHWKTH